MKTYDTSYRDEILRQTDSGLQVFYAFLPVNFRPKKKFRNPLYNDTKASCHIRYDEKSHRYVMYDFGNPEYRGDCFWLVAKIRNLDVVSDFRQVMKIIVDELHLNITGMADDTYLQPHFHQTKHVVDMTQKEEGAKPYELITKDFSPSDIKFWARFGITKETLGNYDVVSLAEFKTTNRDGMPYSYKAKDNSPIFAYLGEDYLKLYRPKEKNRFQYAGKMPSPYCFGIKQLPSHGDMLFVVGGEKDVMSLAAHGFNAICFNSETATIPHSTIELVALRFQHIIIMYDCDETGLESMEKAKKDLEDFNVLTLRLPLSGMKVEKDISDFFAIGHTSEDLRKLIRECIEQLHTESLLLMKTCEMDYSKPPVCSENIISTAGVPLGTYDNLLCISGGEGTGKSNFVSALVAGTLLTEEPFSAIDTLGFRVTPNFESKAVLHFDTEQSEYQLYKNVRSAVTRAGLKDKPDFYHTFFMVALTRKQRMKLIKDCMDIFHHRYGGIHMVVIDGIADLVRSANDEAESVAVVEELYRLAGIYHTCIVCVLHFVPNGLKLRGHIGSELQRKAASILSIEKDGKSPNSVVKTLKVRDGNPLDVPIFLFKWDKERAMYVSNGQKSEAEKQANDLERYRQIARESFQKSDWLSYTELCARIQAVADVKPRTAQDYITRMVEHNILAKNPDNRYVLKRF